MNELVKRLSEGNHPVQANRPDTTAKALKERIDLSYVHILFKNTGTEIGIRLDKDNCRLAEADFDKGEGLVHLEGALTLNYDKVRCIVDVNLADMEGNGRLEFLTDRDYETIISRPENKW